MTFALSFEGKIARESFSGSGLSMSMAGVDTGKWLGIFWFDQMLDAAREIFEGFFGVGDERRSRGSWPRRRW